MDSYHVWFVALLMVEINVFVMTYFESHIVKLWLDIWVYNHMGSLPLTTNF